MTPEEAFAKDVVETPVESELKDGFLSYSLSVIHSRAIPDVRDGLKPVQRRILYGMHRANNRSDTPYRKCARVVGEVMGKYHPHGDSAIYDALVRLGQDFSMRVPLIDPHGNFGALDDSPAASRYTECRMATSAEALVGELDEDAVEFRPNYDGEETEPVYLPARFPNLVVNGSTGIAVGMATNLAPHNLQEAVAACKLVLKNPKASVAEIRAVMPGPDFPGGGLILGTDGIEAAYATGRGGIRVRARTEIVELGPRRRGIVITELPYLVGPERVIAKIAELVRTQRVEGIADIKDLSDRHHGLRLVIECKAGVDPQVLLATLCKLTPIEDTFSVNAVVLADGEPMTLSMPEMLRRYVAHRLDVVVRRTRFRLDKAQARAHIVEGLVTALGKIDQVVTIIRGAVDVSDARTQLQTRLELSEIQANHILEMPLRRLTRLEADKLRDELAELRRRIADLEDLLAKPARQRTTVAEELDAVAHDLGVPRRSELCIHDPLDGVTAAAGPGTVTIPDTPCVLTLSTTGLLARTPADGWKGRHGGDDLLRTRIDTHSAATLWGVTGTGQLRHVVVAELPEISGRVRGARVREVFGDEVVDLVAASAHPGDFVCVVTRDGMVKRLSGAELAGARDGATLIGLKGTDRVVAAFPVGDTSEIGIVTTDAQLLRFAIGAVRPQGRPAGGVAGIALRAGAMVLGAGVVRDDDVVLVLSANGRAKCSALSEVPAKGRATSGVRVMTLKGDDRLVDCYLGAPRGLGATTPGGVVKVDLALARRDGAGTSVDGWQAIGVLR